VREIKAYVRANMANHVIEALASEQFLDFSILAVRGITPGLPREAYDYSVELGEAFEAIVKFELVCREENAERLAELIRRAACTGHKGDGMIFIAPIQEAIKMSDRILAIPLCALWG